MSIEPGAKDSPTEVSDRVRPILNQVEKLPTLPSVVTRIMALVDDPKATGQQVGEVVSQDQAMVTAILKIVNSPFYGLNRRISSISHAILLLGFRTLRNLALSSTLLRTFGANQGSNNLDRNLFWRHSVCCAASARLLARRLRLVDAEEAFLAGLIHDMGRIVFDHHFPADFQRVLVLVKTEGMTAVDAERQVFGLDHADVGRLIAQKWSFPPLIADAIGAHHRPLSATKAPELAVVVHLADHLSHRLEQNEGEPSLPPGALDVSVLARVRLEESALVALEAELEGELEKSRAFLNLLS